MPSGGKGFHPQRGTIDRGGMRFTANHALASTVSSAKPLPGTNHPSGCDPIEPLSPDACPSRNPANRGIWSNGAGIDEYERLKRHYASPIVSEFDFELLAAVPCWKAPAHFVLKPRHLSLRLPSARQDGSHPLFTGRIPVRTGLYLSVSARILHRPLLAAN